MIVLSIDPAWAKPMAYAVFRDGQLCFHDKFRTTKELCVTNADVVVTEDPYLGGDVKKYSSRGHEEYRIQLTGGVLDEDLQDAILIGMYYIDHVLIERGIEV